jgi:hypothetical protein
MKKYTIIVQKAERRSPGAQGRRYIPFCAIDLSLALGEPLIPLVLDIAGRFPESEGFKIDMRVESDPAVQIQRLEDFIINAPGAVK